MKLREYLNSHHGQDCPNSKDGVRQRTSRYAWPQLDLSGQLLLVGISRKQQCDRFYWITSVFARQPPKNRFPTPLPRGQVAGGWSAIRGVTRSVRPNLGEDPFTSPGCRPHQSCALRPGSVRGCLLLPCSYLPPRPKPGGPAGCIFSLSRWRSPASDRAPSA